MPRSAILPGRRATCHAPRDFGGAATTHDLAQTFSYNPAGQIASVTRSNDAYGWLAHYNVDRQYVLDGLNRIPSTGSGQG